VTKKNLCSQASSFLTSTAVSPTLLPLLPPQASLLCSSLDQTNRRVANNHWEASISSYCRVPFIRNAVISRARPGCRREAISWRKESSKRSRTSVPSFAILFRATLQAELDKEANPSSTFVLAWSEISSSSFCTSLSSSSPCCHPHLVFQTDCLERQQHQVQDETTSSPLQHRPRSLRTPSSQSRPNQVLLSLPLQLKLIDQAQ
jgi:hypothetical protein